jgi:uncharacterized membrane protein
VDYRLLCLIALVAWGVWGFLCKLATRTASDHNIVFWIALASLVPMVAYALTAPTRSEMRPALLPIAAGVLAGVATAAFYLALRRGPASVVVPISGMYILIPAVLGIILLKEPLSASHVVGMVFAGLAVLLLSR